MKNSDYYILIILSLTTSMLFTMNTSKKDIKNKKPAHKSYHGRTPQDIQREIDGHRKHIQELEDEIMNGNHLFGYPPSLASLKSGCALTREKVKKLQNMLMQVTKQ